MIERRKARLMLLALVFLAIAALLYVAAGRERSLRLVQADLDTAEVIVQTTGEPIVSTMSQTGTVQVTAAASSSFDEYRMDRDKARAAQVELLQGALAEKGLDPTRAGQLTAELLALLKKAEREMQAEALLRAKGFTDAVVIIDDGTASAVLPDTLAGTDAAKVGDLVARVAGVALERITIIDGAT